jgi:acetyltransferase-like isoleucine patch superfamily enzyme
MNIHPTAIINVNNLSIGKGAKIGRYVVIKGTEVIIGREAFIDDFAYIGGGSAFDECAFFHAGDFLHMGRDSHVNPARGVTVGNEVGIGVDTKIFTHGAYLSELDGFPVQFAPVTIGNRVWLPNAWVNPGVTIGSDVVVAARSLVNRDIPSGCLAGGIPAKIIRRDCYPTATDNDMLVEIAQRIALEAIGDDEFTVTCGESGVYMYVQSAVFNLTNETICGSPSDESELVRNQLRRHGIRFRYEIVDGMYAPWEQSNE